MDPITIYHLGKVRQQEILDSAAQNWYSEPRYRIWLAGARRLIQQARQTFATQSTRQPATEFGECAPECE